MDFYDLKDLLRKIISEKISKNEAFTAFDITMISKKRGNSIYRHSDCKHTIHQIVRDEYPTYQRTLIDVPGAPVQPFLYYPLGYDIDDYIPMDREELFEPVSLNVPLDSSDNEDDEEEDWYDDDDDDENSLW